MHHVTNTLIVEDNKQISELLSYQLKLEGFGTLTAFSGRQALDLAAKNIVGCAIIDLNLPDIDGWNLCRRLIDSFAFPILILSATGTMHECLRSFESGADDYVIAPFSSKEVAVRIKVILRRVKVISAEKEVFFEGDIVLNTNKQTVTMQGRKIYLTNSEYKLLKALIGTPGRVYCRDELLRYLYPSGGVVIDRVVDVHIGHLRRKIEIDLSNPRYILTVRGFGYRFADNNPLMSSLN